MSAFTRLPRLHDSVLQRVTAPQYDVTHSSFAHLDWVRLKQIEHLGRLKSIADAISNACDEHVFALVNKGENAGQDADALADEASGPLNDLIRALIQKGMVQ